MYLFSRRARLTSLAGLEWAAAVGALAGEVSGQHIDLWQTVYSAGYGTIVWTAWFEELAALQTMSETLEGNDAYLAKTAEAAQHIEGGADDAVAQLIAGEPGGADAYVYGVNAVCAAGNQARAMASGAEIAETAAGITGSNTLFLRAFTGPFGGIGWLTGAPDLAAIQANEDALTADPSWLKLIDSTEGAFVEDVSATQVTIYRKLS